ncbi:MAG TPA: hypothetical protein VGY50_05770 [Streptosporangiaceae bacterium]|jgi:hypothetical protein|nr:hypothetical protein [Streptosporangiaceae bacterium]
MVEPAGSGRSREGPKLVGLGPKLVGKVTAAAEVVVLQPVPAGDPAKGAV